MVQCPKCGKKLNPVKIAFRGDSNCPACHVGFAVRNQAWLSGISVFFGLMVVEPIKMMLGARGQALTWSWRFILTLWVCLLIYVILNAFFLRVYIKTPEDKPLNLT
jgi:hypothetical protein